MTVVGVGLARRDVITMQDRVPIEIILNTGCRFPRCSLDLSRNFPCRLHNLPGSLLPGTERTLHITLPFGAILRTDKMEIAHGLPIHSSILGKMANGMNRGQRASAEFLMLPNLIEHFDWAIDFGVIFEHMCELLQDSSAALMRRKFAP